MSNVHVTQGWAKGERVEWSTYCGSYAGRVSMVLPNPNGEPTIVVLPEGSRKGQEVHIRPSNIKPATAYAF